MKVCDGQNLLNLVISEELEWTLQISNCSILSSATILQHLPSNLSCLEDLRISLMDVKFARVMETLILLHLLPEVMAFLRIEVVSLWIEVMH